MEDFIFHFKIGKGVSYTSAGKVNFTNCLILFVVYQKALLMYQALGLKHYGTSLPKEVPWPKPRHLSKEPSRRQTLPFT